MFTQPKVPLFFTFNFNMKFRIFITFFLTSLVFVNWFAHHTIKTTAPRQILSKYKPTPVEHGVFLGSALTDSKIDLDSLNSNTSTHFKYFNLAFADLSDDDYYYLILKNWILKKGLPK